MAKEQKKYYVVNKLSADTAEVLLYGFIDPYDVSASDFAKEMRSLEKEYANINVRINSGGGSVFEGFAIYNAIKNSQANIETYIDGLAASMASIIALAGKKVHMSKMARLMTHQPSSGSYGNSEDLRKNADLLDGLEKTMCAIYAAKTGKTPDECKTCFLNGKDNWFDAQQAKDNGLVDEIYDAEGVEMPKETGSVHSTWNHYQHQFAAKFNQSNTDNMEKVFLSPTALAALKIGDNADQTAIDARIADLVAKANQLDAMKTDKEKAENDLKTYKETAEAAEATTLLTAALNEKKLTVEMQKAFGEQFKGNLAGLKAILATLKPYEAKAGNGGGEDTELGKLSAKSYKQLDEAGELPKLKALSLEVFKAKFKEHFSIEYTGQ
jgi:ATP-dependent Clp endopeptidase proteolytic subunit ClpP